MGVLAEALDPLGDVGRAGRQASGVDVPALAGELARAAVMSSAVWRTTQLASSELNLMIFSCSAGSLRLIASCPNHSEAEKPS